MAFNDRCEPKKASSEWEALLTSCQYAVYEAGQRILPYYNGQKTNTVTRKADQSPLSAADQLAHDCLLQKLSDLTPNWPVLSEESADTVTINQRWQWSWYWLVDPLDGTKEFLHQQAEFTVNVALIAHGEPILGVVYAPALGVMYGALAQSHAYKIDQGQQQDLPVFDINERHIWRIVGSSRHGQKALNEFLSQFEHYTLQNYGSSLKLCKIAEGQAHLYPRVSPTMEWDTGAGQCIVEAAGGAVVNKQGKRLLYNQDESLQNPDFVAVAKPSLLARLKAY